MPADPSTVARHHLRWSRPPTRWHEAPFVGSGALGCHLVIEAGRYLCIHVGRQDVQRHLDEDAPSSGWSGVLIRRARLPVGVLRLDLHRVDGADLELDLGQAEIRGRLDTATGPVELQVLAPIAGACLLIRLRGASGAWAWTQGPVVSPRTLKRGETPRPDEVGAPPRLACSADGGRCSQSLDGGWWLTSAWRDRTAELGWRETAVVVAYGRGEQDVEADHSLAGLPATSELVGRHRAAWQERWSRSAIRLPDPMLEQLWYLQIYKLASASWPGGPTCDLMGPWFHPTPWPGMWWNLNMQLTYAGAALCNQADLLEPLDRWFTRNAPVLAANAPPGAHAAAALGRVSVGDNLERSNDEYANLVWALQVWDDALLRQADRDGLHRRLYPLLTRAVGHLLNLLREGADGHLHLPEGVSPEYKVRAADTNYALALLRWGCHRLLQLAAAQDDAHPDRAAWSDTLARLTPYPVNEHGLMIGAGVGFDVSHRHYSHLLMYHPLQLESWEEPAARALIERSLARWHSFPDALQGYSYTGGAAMHAHLGQGERAVELLRVFADRFLHPNSFYSEFSDNPVIETPLHAAWVLTELLLQEHDGVLTCFAGVPEAWREASFTGLRATGGVLVSAWRRNGVCVGIRLHAEVDASLRLRWRDGIEQLRLTAGETVTLGEALDEPDLRPAMACFGLPSGC